jgi:hypothetical protein
MAQSPPAGFTVDSSTAALPSGFKLDSQEEAAQPGFVQRLGEATGVPTTTEQLKAAKPTFTDALLGPAGMAGKAIYGYGKNLVNEGKIAAKSEDTDSYAPEARFLLRGVLGPVGGTGVANAGTDIKSGNYRGAGGDVLGSLINALLLKKGMAPSAEKSANKLAFAAGKDTAAPIQATLGDLRSTASGGPKPVTVDAFQNVVDSASRNLTKTADAALAPIAQTQVFPTSIVQRLNSLITPICFIPPMA